MTPFPWAEAMQLGLGVLRLPPDQFWRMTPRELAAAIAGLRGGATPPLGRAALDELMRRYPDHQEQAR
ncbi:phage tail assembly chaperone [Rhodopseudomonas palustris]|uniref:rcc01693 family protein n=1 Tax=Rhodopseudomonas palustris TaxID=1076 RepID=UPI0021F272EE|nr:rcc01693 family protein [Rhodopseudomonas palustris]UYO46241.1 phage tail assembly chaperone [Rhodopseudomonas palustris]